MHYRRTLITGATYFFTVNLACRKESLLVDYIDCLRTSVRKVRSAHPFTIIAWVVLPEHMHAIWEMPPGDCDYSMRWNQIKGTFSAQLPATERISASRTRKRERGIWQRRFWEHCIRDEEDVEQHVDYVHYNPVKHGHVQRVVDWPYSSFHRYRQLGWVTDDWGCASNFAGEFGEAR
jgi:putative transposase